MPQFSVLKYRTPLVLEGGSIHVDGEGTLITTKESLLHVNRNPDLSQAQIEKLLKAYTGTSTVRL
jgi:agmatine deiminase